MHQNQTSKSKMKSPHYRMQMRPILTFDVLFFTFQHMHRIRITFLKFENLMCPECSKKSNHFSTLVYLWQWLFLSARLGNDWGVKLDRLFQEREIMCLVPADANFCSIGHWCMGELCWPKSMRPRVQFPILLICLILGVRSLMRKRTRTRNDEQKVFRVNQC